MPAIDITHHLKSERIPENSSFQVQYTVLNKMVAELLDPVYETIDDDYNNDTLLRKAEPPSKEDLTDIEYSYVVQEMLSAFFNCAVIYIDQF